MDMNATQECMSMKNRRLFILWCVLGAIGITLNIYAERWSDIIWIVAVTILLYVIKKLDTAIADCLSIIREQEEYIEGEIKSDVWKKLQQKTSDADHLAMNCHHYLQRIGELKLEIENLKTLNKNLIDTKFNGKCYGNRNPNRRANQKGDK